MEGGLFLHGEPGTTQSGEVPALPNFGGSFLLTYLTIWGRRFTASLRPLTGPMRIPELTVRLQNPQVQYSPGSIPTLGTTPPFQVRTYSLESTY